MHTKYKSRITLKPCYVVLHGAYILTSTPFSTITLYTCNYVMPNGEKNNDVSGQIGATTGCPKKKYPDLVDPSDKHIA